MVGRVYLDTNVYCRPLDDQNDGRIRAESNVFMEIADIALCGKIAIISSDYMKFEIEQILDPLKRKDVKGFERTLSSATSLSVNNSLLLPESSLPNAVLTLWTLYMYRLLAWAMLIFLLTCDDEILHRKVCIEKIATKKEYRLKVRNPVNYLKERQRVRR